MTTTTRYPRDSKDSIVSVLLHIDGDSYVRYYNVTAITVSRYPDGDATIMLNMQDEHDEKMHHRYILTGDEYSLLTFTRYPHGGVLEDHAIPAFEGRR